MLPPKVRTSPRRIKSLSPGKAADNRGTEPQMRNFLRSRAISGSSWRRGQSRGNPPLYTSLSSRAGLRSPISNLKRYRPFGYFFLRFSDDFIHKPSGHPSVDKIRTADQPILEVHRCINKVYFTHVSDSHFIILSIP
jgi:hypothetical protein